MPEMPSIDRRTLPVAFERVLNRSPDKTAYIGPDGSVTFTQSYRRAMRIASGFRTLAVDFGSPVLTMLDNSLDALHTWFALGLTGRVEVPVNTAYKATFLSHIVNDSKARVMVVEDTYCSRIAAVAKDLRYLEVIAVRGGAGEVLPSEQFRVISLDELFEHDEHDPIVVRPHDLMGYLYTSGTTGPSKGVRVPHAQAYTYASREDQDLSDEDDVVLVNLPLFHVAGQWFGAYQALIAGATCIVESSFSPGRFWDQVNHYGATTTVLLGGMAQILLKQPPTAIDATNTLRTATVVPIPPDVEEFERRFEVAVGTGFGMTECGAVIVGTPGSDLRGSAGYVRKGFAARVVDNHDIPVPSGVVGELVVRSEVPWTTMDGYYGLPEKTVEIWRNLWLHTGDAFWQDADGRFYFSDRIKDALRRRGENISSFEVEAAALEHPGIREAAAVAVASDLAEDEIKLVVTAQPEFALDEREITTFLVGRLPYFMVPRYLEILPEMPKTPTQKIQKHLIRQSGVTAATWDREAAGLVVDRRTQ